MLGEFQPISPTMPLKQIAYPSFKDWTTVFPRTACPPWDREGLTLRWILHSHTSCGPLCSQGRAARAGEGHPPALTAPPAPEASGGPPGPTLCPGGDRGDKGEEDRRTLNPGGDRGDKGEARQTLCSDKDRETVAIHHVCGLLIKMEHCKYVMLCNVTQKSLLAIVEGVFQCQG